jgi:ATP-dependent Clp protease ATP-binding subunit ClpC
MLLRFDRLSFRAKDAIQRAAEITRRYGHNQIDTEHLLLALIEQVESGIPALLIRLKVDTSSLIDRVVFSLRGSPKTGIPGGSIDQYQLTPRAKRVIEQAKDEADNLGDEIISSEHLFLAILLENGTQAVLILEDAKITYQGFVEELKTIRDEKPGNRFDV